MGLPNAPLTAWLTTKWSHVQTASEQQAQQSAESAPAPASAADDQRPAKTGGAAAQGTCAAPPNASQSGGTQPAAGGGIGSRTLGEDAKSMGRSMSEDDSVDSGLPRGVLHYSPSESTVKGVILPHVIATDNFSGQESLTSEPI